MNKTVIPLFTFERRGSAVKRVLTGELAPPVGLNQERHQHQCSRIIFMCIQLYLKYLNFRYTHVKM